MYEERRAPIYVAFEQPQAFIGGIPGLHHDVIQFIAQEVFHYVLVLVFHFEEVGQHSGWGVAFAQSARLKRRFTDSVE